MFAEFLQHLHRGGQFAYYHVLPQRRSLWYSIDDPAPIDPSAARTNLYFSVHPSREIPRCNAHGEITAPEYVRSQLRTIAAINCLYAEFDAKTYGGKEGILRHVETLTTPAPSAVVDSGGGYHLYWLLREPYPTDTDARLAAAKHIQDRWVGVVGGDPGVKDLPRILRVPGSHNFKYDPPRPVTWVACDLSRTYALVALTAHLPSETVPTVERVRYVAPVGRPDTIQAFNDAHRVDELLERRGYSWKGQRRMVSPYSGSKRDGVSIDTEDNRAFVHTGGDPLCDGYWKRPFDVIRILDHGGDFKRALAAIRGDA